MTPDSLPKALGARENDRLARKVKEAHEKYRASGLTLMGTVITLSTGGLVIPFHYEHSSYVFMVFILPLSLALLHGLYNFVGGLKFARSVAQMHAADFFIQVNKANDATQAISTAQQYRSQSDRAYDRSETICIGMVGTFILLSIGIVAWVFYLRHPALISGLMCR